MISNKSKLGYDVRHNNEEKSEWREREHIINDQEWKSCKTGHTESEKQRGTERDRNKEREMWSTLNL